MPGLGLYNVQSPLGAAQAAQEGAAKTYAAMDKKVSTTSTTTTDRDTNWGTAIAAGALGAVAGFATGGLGFAAIGAASGMMNYMR